MEQVNRYPMEENERQHWDGEWGKRPEGGQGKPGKVKKKKSGEKKYIRIISKIRKLQ